jgi:hypothetical protein
MEEIIQQRAENSKRRGLDSFGIGLTIITITLWIVLFAAGILINSAPYREQIAAPDPSANLGNIIFNWIVVLLVYTPTNIAMLSLLTGLLGALGRCATLHVIEGDEAVEIPKDPINPYLSGVLRGFMTYLLIISGLIVLLETPPLQPQSYDQYVRMASVISVVSFIVSYNPKNFGALLHRAAEAMKKKKPE